MAESNEDDDNTHIWESRNIENQIDVFVFDPYDYLEPPPRYFRTWIRIKISRAISIIIKNLCTIKISFP